MRKLMLALGAAVMAVGLSASGLAANDALAAAGGGAAAVCLSEKSYYIDTRHPIVALSDSMGLDTNPGGSYIIIR